MTEAEVRFKIFESFSIGVEEAKFEAVVACANMAFAVSEIVLNGNTMSAANILRTMKEHAE